MLLLQHARRAARLDADGDLVPLDEQDRTRWDAVLIAEGLSELMTSRTGPTGPGYYRLQAEIAAVHTVARSAADTDWNNITDYYDRLLALHPHR